MSQIFYLRLSLNFIFCNFLEFYKVHSAFLKLKKIDFTLWS